MSTIDYVEQLTYLLFLKMADERTQARRSSREPIVPTSSTGSLLDARRRRAGDRTTATSSTSSASEPGMLGTIFRKAQNKIQDPAKLSG